MIFSVPCTIIPGNSLTGQIFCLKEAEYMQIQQCSHVMPLSGNLCRRNDFLSGLQPSLLWLGGSPPEQSMMLAGNSSLIGVYEGRLIASIPLLDV
ncbi:hypothetical protein DPMN_001626 [Dreissena polymorpha]|uniref:Uncharacterized protein n=1 Tax=Dreissena polymorpha TaxID=45954 RepID=A0A9D4MJN9_DREPO|nr:hypothetical protein DPMN_001626 [Dreissena polymorpha]